MYDARITKLDCVSHTDSKCVEYNLANYFLQVQDQCGYKTGFLFNVYAFPSSNCQMLKHNGFC